MASTSGRIWTGQITGIGSTAVPLSNATLTGSQSTSIGPVQIGCKEVMVQSDPANTTNTLVGVNGAQFVAMTPGQAITLPISNLSMVYVKAASGTVTVNLISRD